LFTQQGIDSSVTRLDLYIGDEGTKPIAQVNTQMINLERNSIGAEGAKSLAEVIQLNSSHKVCSEQ
jgi:hypothetical protein